MVKKAILLSIILFSHFISAQNRIFLRDEKPVDVKYLTVNEEYLILLKTNDTLKIERRIPIDLIDSLQCDNFEFIQNAYEANTKYRSIIRYTRSKSGNTTIIDTNRTNNKHPDTISVSKTGSGYRYKSEYIRYSRLNEVLES
jgi:hypothetical protein